MPATSVELFDPEIIVDAGILRLVEPDLNRGDPAPLPDYSEDGVDLSLIRWMLSLTPAGRLRFVEERITEIIAIRELNATGYLTARDKANGQRGIG